MSGEIRCNSADSLRSNVLEHPRRAEAHQDFGIALLREGRHYEASAAFRRALELSPDLESASEALQHAEGLFSQAACIQTLKGHASQVHDIITLKIGDQELVASASADCTVRLWPLRAGGLAAEAILHHPDQVTSVAWDAATGTLATACLDNICRLWQKSGTAWRRCAELKSASGRFTCMCFPPADPHLVTGSAAGALQKWSISSGALSVGVQGHGGSITDIALHPTKDIMATSSGDGSCKLWDARTLACLHALAGESGGATSCHLALTGPAESPDLQRIVLMTAHLEPMRREARLLLWDVDGSGQEGWVDGRLCAQFASIDDFCGTVKCIPMRSNWGLHAIASSAGTELHVLDLEEACCIFRLEDVPSDLISVSPDGRYVACAGKDSDQIGIYGLERDSMLLTFKFTLSSGGDAIRCLAWSKSSDFLVSGSAGTTCRVWQV